MMVLCCRCHKEEVSVMGQICKGCKMDMTFDLAPKEEANDAEVIEHYVSQRILIGCLECGDNGFAFDAGVKFEENLKWFVLFVNCGACGQKYTDVLEVRAIDDPNEDE